MGVRVHPRRQLASPDAVSRYRDAIAIDDVGEAGRAMIVLPGGDDRPAIAVDAGSQGPAARRLVAPAVGASPPGRGGCRRPDANARFASAPALFFRSGLL